jgi:hypothetical protein
MNNVVCVFDTESLTYTGYCTGCVINPKLTIYHSENERNGGYANEHRG